MEERVRLGYKSDCGFIGFSVKKENQFKPVLAFGDVAGYIHELCKLTCSGSQFNELVYRYLGKRYLHTECVKVLETDYVVIYVYKSDTRGGYPEKGYRFTIDEKNKTIKCEPIPFDILRSMRVRCFSKNPFIDTEGFWSNLTYLLMVGPQIGMNRIMIQEKYYN